MLFNELDGGTLYILHEFGRTEDKLKRGNIAYMPYQMCSVTQIPCGNEEKDIAGDKTLKNEGWRWQLRVIFLGVGELDAGGTLKIVRQR